MVGPGTGREGEATLITLAQAAQAIWCSKRTIQRWISSGALTCYRAPDGTGRVAVKDVMELECLRRRSGNTRIHTRGRPLAEWSSLS
jgi:predicted site-specific integrase-resolvase